MIKFNLTNRVAIVTGGAQGFGLAITERFIQSGAKVIIWDIDEDAAKKAIAKVGSENLNYQIVDVSNFENINKSLKEIENQHGKIDIFVNNAGIAGMNTTVAEYPVEEWNRVINLNLNSVFYCCKAIVPFMIKNDYGRIVNIASIAGKEGNPNASAYSTSKAGVIGLTKSLGQMTEEHINYMLSKIPRNRFAKVDELASLVTWLSSEENSFSTSAVFDLSGGRATY
jgi:NAD(P)-dependent dehydrogenase (short-subunit alcohol dehydrogenase family)